MATARTGKSYSGSETMMTNFIQALGGSIAHTEVQALYRRPPVHSGQAGQPCGDLRKKAMPVTQTCGALTISRSG